MSDLTIINLFTILIACILIPLGSLFFKKYKTYFNPTEGSETYLKKKFFYIETFSESVKPIFINYIKDYFLTMTENENSFNLFDNFIKKLTRNFKQSCDNNSNEVTKDYYKRNLIDQIKNTDIYDSVFEELDDKEVKEWVNNFKKFDIYPKCIKKFKQLSIYSFIAVGFLIGCLFVFDLFFEKNLAYLLYLGFIFTVYIILAIFYLISHFKCFKPINKLYKQKFSQKIPLKS